MKKNKISSFELIHFLKGVQIFSDLSLAEIRKFIKYFNIKSFKKDQILFKEGDKGDTLYIINDGKVEITIKLLNGSERIVADFKKGDFFGEMSIFDKAPRSATCKIKEDSVLLILKASKFFKIIENNPYIAIKIMYNMLNITTQRLQESNQFLTDMVQWGEEARKRSITDPLTGVYNRRFLDDQINDIFNNALKENKPLSLVMSDLDHFRKINELYSLSMGDRAIIEVSKAYKKIFRDKDIIVRLGGDEYTIVMPDTPKSVAKELCEKACEEVRKIELLKDLDGPLKNFTLSIGLATFPDDAKNLNELKQKSDDALYLAKELGRNRVICF